MNILILHCQIKNFKVMKISAKTILVTLALVLSIVAKGESNNQQLPIELVKTEKKERKKFDHLEFPMRLRWRCCQLITRTSH